MKFVNSVLVMIVIGMATSASARTILKCTGGDGSHTVMNERALRIVGDNDSFVIHQSYTQQKSLSGDLVARPVVWAVFALGLGQKSADAIVSTMKCSEFAAADATLNLCWDTEDRDREAVGEIRYWFSKTKVKCIFASARDMK